MKKASLQKKIYILKILKYSSWLSTMAVNLLGGRYGRHYFSSFYELQF